MKIMVCPLNGPRPVAEFAYGGEVRPSPDPDTCSDAEWSRYVFNRSGSPGIKYEWWCHIASGFWFIALRDTACDRVIATYPAEAVRRGLPDHTPPECAPSGGKTLESTPVEHAPAKHAPTERASPHEHAPLEGTPLEGAPEDTPRGAAPFARELGERVP